MAETTSVAIGKIKPNPNNPRIIKDDKFHKLVKSIEFKADKIPSIKGNTTVYGYVKWVGAEPQPSAKLILSNNVEIRVVATVDQARKLGSYLTKHVKISGIGTWKGDELTLAQIIAEDIELFDNLNPDQAFKYLNEKLGKYWKDVDNPNDFIN